MQSICNCQIDPVFVKSIIGAEKFSIIMNSSLVGNETDAGNRSPDSDGRWWLVPLSVVNEVFFSAELPTTGCSESVSGLWQV